jgi:hypothetical protein
VLHRRGRDLVRQPHPLELLVGLDGARLGEERRRVDRVREGVEPGLEERRRLAHHPVGRLGAERELDPDVPVVARGLARELERAQARGSRVGRVVAGELAHVASPRVSLRVLRARLEADEHGVALARKDDGVVAFHAPEVRQVEDVVGRAHDERVHPALGHQGPHALELRVVPRPAHPVEKI